MRAGRPSSTAEYMALFRAVESRRRRSQRLFCDPLASEFLGPRLRLLAAFSGIPGLRSGVTRLIDRRAPGARASGVIRTKLIDDALTEAIAAGARQVVILGAGYDSRLYRMSAIQAVHGFELDHPDTRSVKRRQLERIYGSVPRHVAFVTTDFVSQTPGSALLGTSYDPATVTFFIWEGVTNYLTETAVDDMLRWIASHAPPGSQLSFTYVHRGLVDGSVDFPGVQPWLEEVRRAGEPFTFGLDPATIVDYLAQRGLRLLSDTSTADACEWLRRWPNGAIPASFYHVALAEVAGPDDLVRRP